MSADDSRGTETVDVLVVGAGPAALAVVAYLLHFAAGADDPAALVPRNRHLFSRRADGSLRARFDAVPPHLVPKKGDAEITARAGSAVGRALDRSALRVVDAHGTWAWSWRRAFSELAIEHLRSSVGTHIDPTSTMALHEACYKVAAERGLRNGAVPVTKSLPISGPTRTYAGPFAVPSSEAFGAFLSNLQARYNLDRLIEPGEAKAVRWHSGNHALQHYSGSSKIIEVELADGRVFLCRHLVLALGPGLPIVPEAFSGFPLHGGPTSESPAVLHLSLLGSDSRTKLDVRNGDHVAIVGAGMTAAHAALRVLAEGLAGTVSIISRKRIKVQHFDVADPWLSAGHRMRRLASFWSLSCPELRLAALREARGGGSISPLLWEALAPYRSNGRLRVIEDAEVLDAAWVPDVHRAHRCRWTLSLSNNIDMSCDAVWLGTGFSFNCLSNSLTASLYEMQPVGLHGGLPNLTEDLRWADGCNVFVVGAAAALRGGPASANLQGARECGARVARAVLDDLGSWPARAGRGAE